MQATVPEIILASASPRRKELLAQAGINIQVIPSRVEETPLPGESPEAQVIRLSQAKALEVAERKDVEGRWFIGSDTVVVRDTEILGKPGDAQEATRMLKSLSGRRHQVISGYAVHDRSTGRTEAEAVSTQVWFKKLTAVEIAGYIATGEPFDKAGSYAIQELGVFMVSRIEGSYSNVVGLPLCELIISLEKMGALRLFAE